MSDQRKLTFIVVPDGEIETRSLEIPYRWLKVLIGAGVVLLVLFTVMVSSWWFIAAQATRVPGLERHVERLEHERQQVVELARTLEEVEARYEAVRRLLGADAMPEGGEAWLAPLRSAASGEAGAAPSAASSRPDAWPLPESRLITQQATLEGPRQHPGIDIAAPQDAYIRAAGAGVVKEAGSDRTYGNFVIIDHGDGLESMYGHASRVFVEAGDKVERAEIIALSGSTGRSTAPHLHFEIRQDGEPVDPTPFVRGS